MDVPADPAVPVDGNPKHGMEGEWEMEKGLFMHSPKDADDDSQEREESADDPEAHRHFALAPFQRLEMVMDRSRPEHFLPAPQLLARELDDDGQHLDHEHETHEGEDQNLIRHEGNDAERPSECEGPRIAHEEQGRRDVVPKESPDRPRGHRAERRKDGKPVKVGDDAEGPERDHEETAGEPVEPVGHIHRIRRSDDDKNENRHVPGADVDAAQKRDVDLVVSELQVEPQRSHETDEEEGEDFREPIEALLLPGTDDVEVIVNAAEDAETHEDKEREIDLAAAQERMVDDAGEGKDARGDDRHEYGPPDEDPAHVRRSDFILVILPEDLRFPPVHGLHAQLFPDLVLAEKRNEPWRQDEAEHECEECVPESFRDREIGPVGDESVRRHASAPNSRWPSCDCQPTAAGDLLCAFSTS